MRRHEHQSAHCANRCANIVLISAPIRTLISPSPTRLTRHYSLLTLPLPTPTPSYPHTLTPSHAHPHPHPHTPSHPHPPLAPSHPHPHPHTLALTSHLSPLTLTHLSHTLPHPSPSRAGSRQRPGRRGATREANLRAAGADRGRRLPSARGSRRCD